MKRFWMFLAVVVLILALPVTNLIAGPPTTRLSGFEAPDPALQGAVEAIAAKCAHCHVADAPLPFYARFPVADGIIQADIDEGTRAMDYERELTTAGRPASEVALARTEHVVLTGSMPPTKYLLLHWDGGLSDEQSATVLRWLRLERMAHYSTGTAGGEFATEVVQPLPDRVELDERKVALGDRIFHDTRLSGDDTVSCASCHALDKGGTDQVRFSTGVGGAVGDINSPTVFNSGHQFKQFWDGRAADLEEQADGPVNNPIEMKSNWPQVIGKLEKDEEFVRAFEAVYPDGLGKENLIDAIATFERSLVTPDSRLDRYLEGDREALTEAERSGYELFKHHGCATCHVGRLLGGRSFELMGRRQDYFAERGQVGKADQGRFNVTGAEADRHRFKVPTLRNIELTQPYLHDGSTDDLAEVVRIMARCELDSDLAETEVVRIVQFLRTLTGTYKGEPLQK